MRDPRLQKLAQVLVHYSVGVQKNQLVRINAPPPALPLVTELYRQVLLAGAHPIVRLNPEELTELLLKHGSDDQLKFTSPLQIHEVQTIDASIGVWAEENTRALTQADPKRLALSESARKPWFEIFMKRAAEGSLKWCGTQYPTQGCAQDAEMSLAEYEDFVFSAGHLYDPDPVASWKHISQSQQRLTDFLNDRCSTGHGDYRVVAPNGTDIRLSVAKHTWINCDGHENFPDGEVFSGPVLDSVNGQLNFSFPAVHHGREVDGVQLTFKNGKVTDARAKKGENFLHSMLDMDPGSRFLGECAIGANYAITRYTRNTLFDEKIGGTVHFALGAGYPETGNANPSALHWDMVVDLRQGGHIEIDGIKFGENGKFTREGFPLP